jgi:predicted nucleic acid-binding protein
LGARVESEAVADAGPLIHLTEIGCLYLLAIFDALHVPDAVWRETVGSGRVPEDALLGLGTVQRHTVPRTKLMRFTRANGLEAIHDGERESLCVCQQIGVSVLLTDDLAVREASKRHGLTPVGSLGIAARAYWMGRLSLTDVECFMTDLYDVSTLFVTRAIVNLAIEQLRSLRGRVEPPHIAHGNYRRLRSGTPRHGIIRLPRPRL